MSVAWLFVRRSQSIRVEQQGDTPALSLAGPGPERAIRQFPNFIELAEFMVEMERRLRGEGWGLERTHTRRTRRRMTSNGRRAGDTTTSSQS